MALQRDLMANSGGVRPRLLVVQPLVGIGDMVWHKPWIDHLAAPLDEAIALINAARLFVGNDSSLLNLAAACGRPAAGIFAQSRPLDYSDVIIPIAEPDGRFGEPGAIARITAAQAFDVVAVVLASQSAAKT